MTICIRSSAIPSRGVTGTSDAADALAAANAPDAANTPGFACIVRGGAVSRVR